MSEDEPVLASAGGWSAIPNSVCRSTKLSASAKLVYLSISSRINFPDGDQVSHAVMATEASCSIATVKRALNELRAAGVVDWESRGNGEGGQGRNAYRLIVSPAFDARTPASTPPF